jgi:hypothetical protein
MLMQTQRRASCSFLPNSCEIAPSLQGEGQPRMRVSISSASEEDEGPYA